MILVKIELVSAIHPSRSRELGRMVICNDGEHADPRRGNYNVELMQRGTIDRVLKRAKVVDYPRLSYPVWVLIARALKNLGVK